MVFFQIQLKTVCIIECYKDIVSKNSFLLSLFLSLSITNFCGNTLQQNYIKKYFQHICVISILIYVIIENLEKRD